MGEFNLHITQHLQPAAHETPRLIQVQYQRPTPLVFLSGKIPFPWPGQSLVGHPWDMMVE